MRTPSGTCRLLVERACLMGALAGATGLLVGGCTPGTDDRDANTPGIYNNATDPTNGGAAYVGSAACSACHPDYAERVQLHGHTHALKPVTGGPPQYPAAVERAGVPDPPAGFGWTDVAFVIDGYLHRALFVGQDGFLLTDGGTGVNSQWNLASPANGTPEGFAPFVPDAADVPFEFSMLSMRTTGAQPEGSQGGRPGIAGTWVEAGVNCEACHGPGSRHVPNPEARDLYVANDSADCAACHTGGDDPDVIPAGGGYVVPSAQFAELRRSGGHAGFTCGICHDSHCSTVYDRECGLRNACAACHADTNLAIHQGFVFVRGDYTEPLTCVSCHMPFTGLQAAAAGPEVVGAHGRQGDVRGHLFRINTASADYHDLFSADGARVQPDGQGRFGVTLDFVCLRCHNGVGNAFTISAGTATSLAPQMHAIGGSLP